MKYLLSSQKFFYIFLIAIFLLGAWGFWMAGSKDLAPLSILNSFYMSFQLFMLESDPDMKLNWQLQLARFLAPLGLIGTFLAFFTSTAGRVALWWKSLVLGPRGYLFLNISKKEYASFAKFLEGKGIAKRIVCSLPESEETFGKELSALGASIVIGDSGSPDTLSAMRSWRYKRIFIGGDSDEKVFEILSSLGLVCSRHARIKRDIWLALPDEDKADFVQNFTGGELGNIICFNPLKFSAQKLLGKFSPHALHPSLAKPFSQESVTLGIVGFDPFADFLLEELVFSSVYSLKNNVVIKVFFHESENKHVQRFKKRFEGVESSATQDINWIPFDTFKKPKEETFKALQKSLEYSSKRVLYVTEANPLENLKMTKVLCGYLEELGKERETPVVSIFADNDEDLIPVSAQYPQLSESVRVNVFCLSRDGSPLNSFLLDDNWVEKAAMREHEAYLKEQSASKPTWFFLNESLRDSNRRSVRHSLFKASILNLAKEDGMDLDKTYEYLSQLEHKRWTREKALKGWSFGEKRNNTLKKHPSMVDYDLLSEHEKNKDRNNVKVALEQIKRLKK